MIAIRPRLLKINGFFLFEMTALKRGVRLNPSIGFSMDDSEIPAMSASVGNMSTELAGYVLICFGLIFPGHSIIAGTRMPPSYKLPL